MVFDMLVFFTNLSPMELHVRYLALFRIFPIIDYFVVLDRKSSQEYPVNSGVLKAPFLVLHFSVCTLMNFLSMLYVILLMILLSTLNLIRYLICGNSKNGLLNLNLIYKTL